MNLSDLLQMLVSGLAMGGLYTLMAKGLLITYLTTRALNFGQGDFLMIASFLSMGMLLAGMPPLVVLPLVVAIVIGLGIALERVAIRPLARQLAGSAGSMAWILTTMGFGMLLQNSAQLIWGKSRYSSPPLFSGADDNIVQILGVGFYMEELVVAVVSLLVVGLFYWFLFRARWGQEITAVSFDKGTAALLGIDVRRVVIISYAMMAVLAALCGILAGPITTVQTHMGLIFTLKGFAVVCIGGFANPIGILIAGFGFGIAEAFCNYFDSAFGDLYPFVFALVFLVIRPSGIFGEARTDVR